MFQTFRNAWKLTDLRQKLLFTLFIVVLFRIGCVIPVPYVNSAALEESFQATSGSLFQYFNILSGEAFSRATLFALSISPYITAQIIIQLLTIAIPALERLSKSGEDGRKKIETIVRYATVGLGTVTAYGYYIYLRSANLLTDNSAFAGVVIVATYAAGSALIMWLAEKVNERGIGNGISIILFANIVSSLPSMILTIVATRQDLLSKVFAAALTTVIAVIIIAFVVFMTNSERRVNVQYAKKVVGRKMYGGQSTFLPIKLNMSGVMPIIFAQSIVSIPATLQLIFSNVKEGGFWSKFFTFFSHRSPVYAGLLFLLIIAFSYFYLAISFNPIEVANNLKKNGGFVPGIRPGKPTSDFITKILNKITLIGAFFLGIIAILPIVLAMTSPTLSGISFGGTSLLIVVGVALETARELESHMTMRHYKGFLE